MAHIIRRSLNLPWLHIGIVVLILLVGYQGIDVWYMQVQIESTASGVSTIESVVSGIDLDVTSVKSDVESLDSRIESADSEIDDMHGKMNL